MTKEKLEKDAREYLAEHSEYSEVFEETIVAVDTLTAMVDFAEPREKRISELEKENAELKELIEKYRQAVDKCLHITFMGGGCEVNTIGQYATLVDGYLTDVEG